MDGFKDTRTVAELLLAPKKPLSRSITGLSSLKLNLGGDAASPVLSPICRRLPDRFATRLTAALKSKAAQAALVISADVVCCRRSTHRSRT
jgi:hypothetical protein